MRRKGLGFWLPIARSRECANAAIFESSGGQSDVQQFIYDGSDLIYRQFVNPEMTTLDQPDFPTGDNGMLYLYGPTGLIMEFDRFGYNSRTFLYDPNGSLVSTSNGIASTYNNSASITTT